MARCLVSVITLHGQLVGTKWFRFPVHQTEICPRVPGGSWLDVQAEAGPPLAPHDGEPLMRIGLPSKLIETSKAFTCPDR